MTLQLLHSEFPLYMRKIGFSFYQYAYMYIVQAGCQERQLEIETTLVV